MENTITSQSQSITSLTSTINTIRTQELIRGLTVRLKATAMAVLGGNGTTVVVASQKFTGNKSLQVSRGANNNGNSDKQLGSWQSVREDAKFRFEFWAMMPADQAPSSGWTTLVGINSLNAAGQNSRQSAVTVSEAALGARDKWVKFTGIASNNGVGEHAQWSGSLPVAPPAAPRLFAVYRRSGYHGCYRCESCTGCL